MLLKIKRTHADAIIPHYATAGAACFDIHALHDGVLIPGSSQTFRTGLAFEIPAGWVLEVYSRSGHGFKQFTRLNNCVGIIDSDYRDELMVALTRDDVVNSDDEFFVRRGDRIAQAKLVPAPQVELVEVFELSDTERGANGFGSTGQ